MIKRPALILVFLAAFQLTLSADLRRDAESALEKAVKYFRSISVEGGYVYFVTPDLDERWGEGPVDDRTIEVQSPGTPAIGMAMLRVFEVIEYNNAMRAAKEAATALIKGQNELGGWGHVINFDQPPSRVVSFDDDQTQGAISFLMAIEQKFADDEAWAAVEKALNLMTSSQLNNGGWPHQFPRQGNYHDYATFNDQGINDCIRVMIEADNYYSNAQIQSSLYRAAQFILASQLPPPQSGWAQQYNEYNQPAWARSFEPPSACPSATLHNLDTLMDLALYFNNRDFLEPIHDSLAWLDETQLPNGLWPRFVALGTGEALYYDRGRIRVGSTDELSEERRTGYGYATDLSSHLEKTRERFNSLWFSSQDLDPSIEEKTAAWFPDLEKKVQSIIDAQDNKGRWITKDDRFKHRVAGQPWTGEWVVKDRISSQVFIDNVEALCEYLDLYRRKRIGGG